MRCRAILVVSWVMIVPGMGAAMADEVFLCPDKTLVRIDSAKRAQQYEHPCAKAWFGSAGTPPVVAGAAVTTPSTGARSEDASDEPVRLMRAGRRR